MAVTSVSGDSSSRGQPSDTSAPTGASQGARAAGSPRTSPTSSKFLEKIRTFFKSLGEILAHFRSKDYPAYDVEDFQRLTQEFKSSITEASGALTAAEILLLKAGMSSDNAEIKLRGFGGNDIEFLMLDEKGKLEIKPCGKSETLTLGTGEVIVGIKFPHPASIEGSDFFLSDPCSEKLQKKVKDYLRARGGSGKTSSNFITEDGTSTPIEIGARDLSPLEKLAKVFCDESLSFLVKGLICSLAAVLFTSTGGALCWPQILSGLFQIIMKVYSALSPARSSMAI